MTFDCSRLTFHPWKDFFGVVMQQGRVQLDSDWNEWVTELARRIQAGTLDTMGRAVVPRTTPDGFNILASGGALTIGRGRIYVDGLLAENHGALPPEWDAALAELRGTGPLPFFEQPYLPFNPTNQPAPADVFNRPALSGGPHLVYVDVWQRELTHLQDDELIEKAVGIDTTERLQTAWHVKLLPNVGDITCATPDDEVPGWLATIRPSGARLTNSTGDVPGDPNPCLIPPAAGYKGLENQLYRVEIHHGGPQGTATFKWSRDNATVASRVTEIQGGNRLVVESLGRDEVLGFHGGDWIEILDDWHELHRLPGLLRRIRLGDGIDAATRSILIDDALPNGLFPVDAEGRTDAARHTRIRRWDQSGIVRRADGTAFHDLNASASSDGIPVPAAGAKLSLENGILVEFALEAGGEYKVGDYWVFAARVADGSIEPLDHAPPRGLHHHYARLALVTFPDSETDCRTLWPPEAGGASCDCTVCVHPEGHNAGTATIQQAIDQIRSRGGTICLDAGVYNLRAPLNFEGARSVRLRGQGWMTVLRAGERGSAIEMLQCIGVAVENLSVLGGAAGERVTAAITAVNCVDLRLEHLAIVAIASGDATSAGVGLSGLLLGGQIRDCTIIAEQGIANLTARRDYLFTADLRLTGNLLLCSQRGLSLAGACLHYGELRASENTVLGCSQAAVTLTGAALPGTSVTIADNQLNIAGNGIVAGIAGLRIADNEILGGVGRTGGGDAIVLDAGLDPGPIDQLYITGNRLGHLRGNGIAIRHPVGQAMIKGNTVDRVRGGGLVIEDDGRAAYLAIENNHFTALGVGFADQGQPYFGLRLVGVSRADVVGNLLAGIAEQAAQAPARVAVLTAAVGEVRIAGNRMFGIGPTQFLGRTVGIAAAADTRQFTADSNSIARTDEAAEAPSSGAWQAIFIGPIALPAAGAEGAAAAITVPGLAMLPLRTGLLHLSAIRVELSALTRGNAAVKGNQLRAQSSTAPLVQIDDVQSCLFDQNGGETAGPEAERGGTPLALLRGEQVGASSNRLIGGRNQVSLAVASKSFAILGNLTSGPIEVNGAALPAPWNGLNVHV
jgi:hypothetical protein